MFTTPIKNSLLLWAIIVAITIIWALILVVLHRLRAREKKRLIIVTTFLAGLFYVLEFFLPGESRIFFWSKTHANPLSPYVESVGKAAMAIGAFTFMLGVINLSMVHGGNISRRRKGWYNSLAFFAALISIIFFGLFSTYWNPETRFGNFCGKAFSALFDGAYVALDSTIFSLLAFYMATAAYRAFRLRSGEATVLVIAAFLVMLGQVPVGMWITSGLPETGFWAGLRAESIALWLQQVISMSGLRAVNFGVGVGALAMALRLWLNLERGAFFEQEF